MPNRYIIATPSRPPVEIDVAEDRPVPDAEIAHFIRGFRILERTHVFDGFTVCFVYDATIPLPDYGDHVIAVVYGDEHCRTPAYAGRVRAVLKCHGLHPVFLPRMRPLRLAQIELAELLRNLALWLPNGWRWLFSRRVRARTHLLPLGYGIPSEEPVRDLRQRRYLVSFLGSIAPVPRDRPLRALVGTPKSYARGQLLAAMEQVRARWGAERVRVGTTPGFQESLRHEQVYAEVMAETLICVAPRGTTRETWRFCDGLKAGCVVIADRLPPFPFYRDAPIIEIDDWRGLPALLERLLRDPEALRARQEAGLRYWREVLSEEALARRYAAALGLAARPPAGEAGSRIAAASPAGAALPAPASA